ncbi:hypothetical protein GCM10027275_07100 [Rhabdobacter roseus]|uniref:Uncharacterized protein n=1 Tax=Rhabdobacter roseus TaxID=1655419 RepID=A0A840TLE5_9BACT|nr:hypothetical protein [Rhabdobacter roseus]MBB5282607.1 hypothetical protein [Rhabdobacter roseus]
MTQKLPADQHMTDVFGRFQNATPTLSEPYGPTTTISNRKKNILGTAAVLLTGGAAFAAINFEKIRDYVEGKELSTDEVPMVPEGELPAETATTTAPVRPQSTAPLRHHTASAVQNGTITPTDTIKIAGQVREEMPFGEAYAVAREEVGPGGIFSWHGQVFNTYTVEEWRDLSLSQRQEFLSDVGYRPTQSTETVESEPTTIATINGQGETVQVPPIADNPSNDGIETIVAEPAYFDLFINGRPALGIDDDHDGIADAIVFLDEHSNNLIAFVDAEGDAMIDTVIQFDTINQQVIGQEAIEVPFMAEISKLEILSNLIETNDNLGLRADADVNVAYNDDNDYTHEDGYVNDADLPEMD